MGEPVQIMLLPAGEQPPQVLLEAGGIWRETTPPYGARTQAEIRRDIQPHLEQAMNKVDGNLTGAGFPTSIGFREKFESLYTELLPVEVRDELQRVADPTQPHELPPLLTLFLTPGAEWIPWELLHDGTAFLGLRFLIVRLPIVRPATKVRGGQQRQVRSLFSLLARGVLEGSTLSAWEATFGGFAPSPGWEHRYPTAGAGNGYPTLDSFELAFSADVIHVTCHGGMRDSRDSGEYFWTLDHLGPNPFNYRITAGVAQKAKFANRPLVFGNACASMATLSADRGALYGFGPSFMIGGALNFVGTCAPITKSMAVDFAARFYSNLFHNGAPKRRTVAEALWAAKKSIADEQSADPSYLFYSLYGPPDTTYEPFP